MEHGWNILLQLVIMLGAALVLGGLFERVKQSAVLGYLAAGVLLGPSGLGVIHEDEFKEAAAELGVTLLLFSVGLEFSLTRLKSLGTLAGVGGSLQVALTALVVAVIGTLFGLPLPAALVLGLIVAPSSTATVLRLLADRTEMDSIHGRNSLGILLLQDIALVPLVLLVTSLSSEGSVAEVAMDIGKAVGASIVLVLLLWTITNFLLPHLFTAAALLKNRELAILLAIVTAIGSAWVTHHAGLSPALGAFIAGILLAESPFATQVRADIGVLKTLFLTLFFTSVGILADLGWMGANLLPVVLAVAGLIAIKALVVWAVLLVFRQSHHNAAATGLCLAQAGEFSFVLAGIAYDGGGMGEDLFRLLISANLATLFLTPFMVSMAVPAGRAFEAFAKRVRIPDHCIAVDEPEPAPTGGHVIIVGFGPTGQSVARSVCDRGDEVVIVEMNPKTVEAAREMGQRAYLGDASHGDILEHLHVASAKAVIVTIPDHRAGVAVVMSVRKATSSCFVVARARYHRFAGEYMEAGADVVLDEEIETGAVLGERIARGMDARSLAKIRQAESGDPDGPALT